METSLHWNNRYFINYHTLSKIKGVIVIAKWTIKRTENSRGSKHVLAFKWTAFSTVSAMCKLFEQTLWLWRRANKLRSWGTPYHRICVSPQKYLSFYYQYSNIHTSTSTQSFETENAQFLSKPFTLEVNRVAKRASQS